MRIAPYLFRYMTRRQFNDAQVGQWGCRWLSPGERQVYARLTDPRRRSAFFLGRLLAKRLILCHCRTARPAVPGLARPSEIEIDSGLSRQQHTSPRVNFAGRVMPWSLSIAHTENSILVALAPAADMSVGVDLVEPAVPGRGFVELWFTDAERRQLKNSEPGLALTFWAIKEAVYKAAGNGQPFAPRAIEVLPWLDGFVCQPACHLTVWQTPQGQTAAIAYMHKTCRAGEKS